MSRFELYSPEGLRVDGRRFNELRYFGAAIGTHAKSADGSAVAEMGTSKVVCTVQGPQEPRSRSRQNAEKATLSVSLIVAPFSSTERRRHKANERQLKELAITIRETFEDVVLTKFAPRTEIAATFHVLAQDGNLLASCVNAMCLALIDAGVPMYDYVAAVAVAVADQTPLLDPNQIETQELPSVTVGIIGTASKVSLLILEKRLNMDLLAPAIDLGIEGCKVIREIMDSRVRERLAAESAPHP